MAFTILLLRLSALASLRDITAQAAAGIQPTMVICSKRQRIPVKIRPLKINESHGNKIAISVMVVTVLIQGNRLTILVGQWFYLNVFIIYNTFWIVPL